MLHGGTKVGGQNALYLDAALDLLQNHAHLANALVNHIIHNHDTASESGQIGHNHLCHAFQDTITYAILRIDMCKRRAIEA